MNIILEDAFGQKLESYIVTLCQPRYLYKYIYSILYVVLTYIKCSDDKGLINFHEFKVSL